MRQQMTKFRIAVVNRILNFRRYAEVIACNRREAIAKAKKIWHGYNEVESCIPIETVH